MLNKDKKQELIKTYQRAEGDTGSCEVQIAILTERIKELTQHLQQNKKDNHSRRGLIKMVSKRKKLLKYYASVDLEGCRALKQKLGIR